MGSMSGTSRLLTAALVAVLAGGAVAFFADITTIRADPAVFPNDFVTTRNAFMGELISVRLGQGWTEIGSTNADVVRPIAVSTEPSTGLFISVWPGQATLHAASIRCPRCAMATIIWRMTIDVRVPPA